MRRYASLMTGPYGVLFTALVLPGGFLILACALYRWIVRRAAQRRQPRHARVD